MVEFTVSFSTLSRDDLFRRPLDELGVGELVPRPLDLFAGAFDLFLETFDLPASLLVGQ